MTPKGASSGLAIAFEPRVARRALAFTVIVGSMLIAINHGDALLARDISGTRCLKMALTLLVPYVVSTWSSVLAVREAR